MPTFDNIILNGRPAGGKSELIDFLKGVPVERRIERYHLGDFVELDDFVWLWEKFIEDDIWESMGESRIYSKTVPHGYVQYEGDRVLEMLLRKLDLITARDYANKPGFYDDNSLFVEFSRGTPDGGYKFAYEQFSKELLERSGIIYINVSFEESVRKNEARYKEKLAHSILAHKLPDESVERFSRDQDFMSWAGDRKSGYLTVKGLEVPFVVIDNEPELTDHDALDERYGAAFNTLWDLYKARPAAK